MPGAFSKPQPEHLSFSGAPHSPQNFMPLAFSKPQAGQRIDGPSDLALAGPGRCDSNGRVSSFRIPAFSLALVLGAILAGGNVLLAQRFAPELLAFPPIVAWLGGTPIVIGLLAAALHRPAVAAPAPPPSLAEVNTFSLG
jgi:hypothetical protein